MYTCTCSVSDVAHSVVMERLLLVVLFCSLLGPAFQHSRSRAKHDATKNAWEDRFLESRLQSARSTSVAHIARIELRQAVPEASVRGIITLDGVLEPSGRAMELTNISFVYYIQTLMCVSTLNTHISFFPRSFTNRINCTGWHCLSMSITPGLLSVLQEREGG